MLNITSNYYFQLINNKYVCNVPNFFYRWQNNDGKDKIIEILKWKHEKIIVLRLQLFVVEKCCYPIVWILFHIHSYLQFTLLLYLNRFKKTYNFVYIFSIYCYKLRIKIVKVSQAKWRRRYNDKNIDFRVSVIRFW